MPDIIDLLRAPGASDLERLAAAEIERLRHRNIILEGQVTSLERALLDATRATRSNFPSTD